jgi:hypothetical protein
VWVDDDVGDTVELDSDSDGDDTVDLIGQR